MAKRKRESPAAFEITEAQPGDEETIAALIYALAEYEKAPEQCKATPGNVKQQFFSRRPTAYCLIARVGGEAVGYAIYYLTFSTWLCRPGLYMEDLFVKAEHRKRGIGGALMRRLAAICVENGYGRMEWMCLEWNELAKQQYRKVGAAPLDEWRTWRLTGEELAALAAQHVVKTVATELPLELPEPPKPPVLSVSGTRVVVYTDGGCRPNPGVGAWAAVLETNGKTREIVGGEHDTTNNRMELSAAIGALESLKLRCEVVIHTDSQYVKNGITTWIKGWKKKGWVSSQKTPVKNVDLWKRLDALCQSHDVKWSWVRGHAGDKYNERCDELCSAEIDRLDHAGS